MASVNELRNAIVKGQVALAEKLANNLRDSGADISKEIELARKLSKLKGGLWSEIYGIIA